MAASWDKLSSMMGSVHVQSQNALEQLLEEVSFQRKKERRKFISEDSDFVLLHGAPYWTDMFVRHFLFETDRSIDADDLLFFVRKKPIKGPTRFLMKYETELEVFRRDSKKLPIGDPDVAWEETLYLNLIIHQFDYTLTMAICTRTSPKDLQVLKRHTLRVYASPSRRRMDVKGDVEEITYPNICFMVDNFDEVYEDVIVRDGEMVCVELIATNRRGICQGVLFLGSIRYEALKRVYDSRASLGSKVAQKFSMGLWGGAGSQRMEFVRMKGPQGKGHSEMAVTKPKGSGLDTPCSEPGLSATELWDAEWDSEPEDFGSNTRQRRLSEPGGGRTNGIVCQRSRPNHQNGNGKKSRSENEGLDRCNSTWNEIEAGDVRDGMADEFAGPRPGNVTCDKNGVTIKCLMDGNRVHFLDGQSAGCNKQPAALPHTELDDGAYNPVWTMKGFAQTFHLLKESRRAQSVPLNALLTYVTVPWYSIISVHTVALLMPRSDIATKMLPKVRFRLLLLALLFVYQTSLAQSNPHYEAIQRLHSEVLKDYNSQVIPLVERGKPLIVSTSLTLTSLEFDEQHSRFAANGFYSMKWRDPRLAWDPELNDGVTSIRLPSDSIWKPDIEVYNMQGKLAKERIFASTIALAYFNGTTIYVPLNSFGATCLPDATRYPNDEVSCKIIIGSWTHSTENVIILTDNNATEVNSELFNNKQIKGWELVSTSIVSKEQIYDCCPNDPYQSLEYNFVIQRRAPLAVFAITIPAILISLLTLGSLLMPVQTSSRLIVGMINLLITCSYLLYLHTSVVTVGSTPLVVQYFGALGILITISVLQAALGIQFVSCLSDQNGSKSFFKRIFLKPSVRLLSRNTEKDNGGSEVNDENGFARGDEGETSWITVFLAIDRWIAPIYIIIFAALMWAYLV